MSRLGPVMSFLGLSRPGQQPLLSPRAAAIYFAVLLLAAGVMVTASVLTTAGRPLTLTAPLYALGLAVLLTQITWATRRRRRTRHEPAPTTSSSPE